MFQIKHGTVVQIKFKNAQYQKQNKNVKQIHVI